MLFRVNGDRLTKDVPDETNPEDVSRQNQLLFPSQVGKNLVSSHSQCDSEQNLPLVAAVIMGFRHKLAPFVVGKYAIKPWMSSPGGVGGGGGSEARKAFLEMTLLCDTTQSGSCPRVSGGTECCLD